ncbi:MAG: ATP-binding protein [Myxococcota bacterium]
MVVASGAAAPPELAWDAVAVVVVGDPPLEGWLEVEVDRVVTPSAWAADPRAILGEAAAHRSAIRVPAVERERWLGAVQRLVDADAVALVIGREVTVIGDPSLSAAWEGPGSAARATRTTSVLAGSGQAIRDRLRGAAVDGVVAVALGKAADGVVIAVVRAEGRAWVPRAVGPIRAAARAFTAARRAARLVSTEAEHRRADQLVRRLMSVAGHDLRNALFAVRLAGKVLERSVGVTPQVAALNRSVTGAIDLVRRTFDAGAMLLDPPPVARPGIAAELGEAWARVLPMVLGEPAARTIDGPAPSGRVAVDAATIERLLAVVVGNAVAHGAADRPITVATAVVGDRIRVTVANGGRLAVRDWERVEPFEHRSGGGLGLGLYLARRLAEPVGAALSLVAVDDRVEATLDLPASPAPAPSA